MYPSDLDHEECTALVALLRHVARADGSITDAETDELQELGLEIGGKRFIHAWHWAAEHASSAQAALDYAAEHVAREEARELIVTMLTDLAGIDDLDEAEHEIVAKVRLMWGLYPLR